MCGKGLIRNLQDFRLLFITLVPRKRRRRTPRLRALRLPKVFRKNFVVSCLVRDVLWVGGCVLWSLRVQMASKIYKIRSQSVGNLSNIYEHRDPGCLWTILARSWQHGRFQDVKSRSTYCNKVDLFVETLV